MHAPKVKDFVINTDVQLGSFSLQSPWWLLGEKLLLWGLAFPPPPKELEKLRHCLLNEMGNLQGRRKAKETCQRKEKKKKKRQM